jgi:hypothetical protein
MSEVTHIRSDLQVPSVLPLPPGLPPNWAKIREKTMTMTKRRTRWKKMVSQLVLLLPSAYQFWISWVGFAEKLIPVWRKFLSR